VERCGLRADIGNNSPRQIFCSSSSSIDAPIRGAEKVIRAINRHPSRRGLVTVPISQRTSSWAKVRATGKNLLMLKRQDFPEATVTGVLWQGDLPIPRVRRHTLPSRSGGLHIGRAVFSDQAVRADLPRNPGRRCR
jgi:hypothetical protein